MKNINCGYGSLINKIVKMKTQNKICHVSVKCYFTSRFILLVPH